jgi:hypothetical protein
MSGCKVPAVSKQEDADGASSKNVNKQAILVEHLVCITDLLKREEVEVVLLNRPVSYDLCDQLKPGGQLSQHNNECASAMSRHNQLPTAVQTPIYV